MERLRSPPALQNLPPSLSTEHQSWLLRLDCDRRPPREKIEATEWAKPTTIPTFTWPLLGIGRPENLCEKFPPLIMALLPPAIAFLRRSKGWWGECKETSFMSMTVGWLWVEPLRALVIYIEGSRSQIPLLSPLITTIPARGFWLFSVHWPFWPSPFPPFGVCFYISYV